MSQEHPFLDNSFFVRWSQLHPEAIQPDLDLAIKAAEAKIDAIVAQPDSSLDYGNTFGAYCEAIEEVDHPWTLVSHLDSVLNTDPLRKAFHATQPKVIRFYTSLPLNPQLWEKLKRFAEQSESAELSPIQRKYIDETVNDFIESGADLPPEQKQRLMEIEEALAEATTRFHENHLDALNAYELLIDDRSRLEGIPESALAAAQEDALAKGHGSEEKPIWRFTLHVTSLFPVFRYADDDGLRHELWEANRKVATEGEKDNRPVIQEILDLRQEKGKLLGKPHFADVVTQRRMAKSGEKAAEFLEGLTARTRSTFADECQALEQFKAAATGQPASPLHAWELVYWGEKMRQATCAFDEEQLRPYFPMESVVNGMFALCEKLFGIRVSKVSAEEKPDVWHPEVEVYNVLDVKDGHHVGSFYTDWHPRETKRSGAWFSSLRSGEPQADGTLSPNLGAMQGNLSKPTANKPALLRHDEVETIFHEFGHCLHHLLSEVEISALGGVHVAWDFVELPSQIMENWCWERESLDFFARHYETGEPLPEDLFQAMLKTRTFRSATAQMRQISFGYTDLKLHMEYATAENKPDLEQWWQEVNQDFLIPTVESASCNLPTFGHLFSDPVGYAAGYYSYKWAEVLEADAFSRFRKEGLLSSGPGMDFRNHILSRGSSEEPEVLYRKFMGRDPDAEALMRRLGLS